MSRWLPVSLAVLTLASGCKKEPPAPAAEGGKCFPADPALGSCEPGLFCDMTRGKDGQPVREKVTVDRTSAVGSCKAKAPLGGACTSNEGCSVGGCLWSDPAKRLGVCGTATAAPSAPGVP